MNRVAAVESALVLLPEILGLVFLLGWFMFRTFIRGARRLCQAARRAREDRRSRPVRVVDVLPVHTHDRGPRG